MLSWKALSLLVAAAVAMNGVVGVEQGYGGGVWTTAPPTSTPDDSPVQSQSPAVTTATPTSTESSTAVDSGSEEYSGSADEDTSSGSDADIGSQVDGSSAIDEGSDSRPGNVHPPTSSTDGSCGSVDFPHPPFGSGSIDFPGSGSIIFPPSPSDVGSGSDEVPPGKGGLSLPSSADGSSRDSSMNGDASTAGEASTGGDGGQSPPTGGCKVRTRRLRQ